MCVLAHVDVVAFGGQNKLSALLKLELLAVVSCSVWILGAKLWKNNKKFESLKQLSRSSPSTFLSLSKCEI